MRSVPDRARRTTLGVLAAGAALLPLGCGSSPSPTTTTATTTGSCQSGDYTLALSTNGATAGVVATAKLHLAAGDSCKLDTQLRLTLQHQGGTPLTHVDGNPAVLPISGTLIASAPLVRDWVWRNWCGGNAAFELVATTGDGGRATRAVTPPACADPASPSRLTPLPGRP